MVNIAFAKCLKAKEGFSAYEQKERRERDGARWSKRARETDRQREVERKEREKGWRRNGGEFVLCSTNEDYRLHASSLEALKHMQWIQSTQMGKGTKKQSL